MHRLTSLLSIQHVFTSGYRLRLNGATERVHRFLNAAMGIYCEHSQSRWEEFLQPAVYAHNTSPISGTSDIFPFFLVFGRTAPSPETLSFDLPPHYLPADHYAQKLLHNMIAAHTRFSQIKSDLRLRQRKLYDSSARDIHVAEGKLVFLRKDSIPQGKSLASYAIMMVHLSSLATPQIAPISSRYAMLLQARTYPGLLTLKRSLSCTTFRVMTYVPQRTL